MRQQGYGTSDGPKPVCTKARAPSGAWWPSETTWACFTNFTTTESPAAISTHPTKLSVFAVGADMRIYEECWDSANGGWQTAAVNLGGAVENTPAVVTRYANIWDLFARDRWSGEICTKSRIENSYWPSQSSWVCFGPNSKIQGSPIAVAAGANELHVFGISSRVGFEGQVVRYFWNGGGWAGPEYMGGNATSVAAVSRTSGFLDVFIREADSGRIYNRWGGGSAWSFTWNSSWYLLDGAGLDISAVTTGSNRLDIVTRYRNDLGVRHRWWYGTGWMP
jgi:hypothetical protein